jgi:hypothetical protein
MAKKERYTDTRQSLAVACAIFRIKGYSNSFTYREGEVAGHSNKDMLTYALYPKLSPKDYILEFHPTDEDRESADVIIRYFRRLSFGIIGDNIHDYLRKVFSVSQNEQVAFSDLGILASIPQSYHKEMIQKEIKSQIKDTVKEHLGQEGQPISVNIKYLSVRFVPTLNCFAHEAVTDTNHLVSFLNKIDLGQPGQAQKIKARVKRHGVNYHTKTPETQINYVKVLETMVSADE